MLFRSTLDIDYNDKEKIKRIEEKILKCDNIVHIHKKLSAQKGFHFILKCGIKCNICRIVYDDVRRFMYDQHRPEYAQNILFDGMENLED